MRWTKRTLIGAIFGVIMFVAAAWFAAPDHKPGTFALAAATGVVIGGFIGLTDWYR